MSIGEKLYNLVLGIFHLCVSGLFTLGIVDEIINHHGKVTSICWLFAALIPFMFILGFLLLQKAGE